jgi:uncharacterized membrane protein
MSYGGDQYEDSESQLILLEIRNIEIPQKRRRLVGFVAIFLVIAGVVTLLVGTAIFSVGKTVMWWW